MSDTPIFDAANTNPEPKKVSIVPIAKVAATGIAGAVTVLVVFAVNLIWSDVTIPPEVSSAFTAIVAFVAGYIKKS